MIEVERDGEKSILALKPGTTQLQDKPLKDDDDPSLKYEGMTDEERKEAFIKATSTPEAEAEMGEKLGKSKHSDFVASLSDQELTKVAAGGGGMSPVQPYIDAAKAEQAKRAKPGKSGAEKSGGPASGTVHRPLRQVANGKSASMSKKRKQDLVSRGLAKWDGPGEISLTAKGEAMIKPGKKSPGAAEPGKDKYLAAKKALTDAKAAGADKAELAKLAKAARKAKLEGKAGAAKPATKAKVTKTQIVGPEEDLASLDSAPDDQLNSIANAPGASKEAKKKAKEVLAKKQFPEGSSVTTSVASIGGKSEEVTGTVTGYKYGKLAVKTDAHGTIMVSPDDATATKSEKSKAVHPATLAQTLTGADAEAHGFNQVKVSAKDINDTSKGYAATGYGKPGEGIAKGEGDTPEAAIADAKAKGKKPVGETPKGTKTGLAATKEDADAIGKAAKAAGAPKSKLAAADAAKAQMKAAQTGDKVKATKPKSKAKDKPFSDDQISDALEKSLANVKKDPQSKGKTPKGEGEGSGKFGASAGTRPVGDLKPGDKFNFAIGGAQDAEWEVVGSVEGDPELLQIKMVGGTHPESKVGDVGTTSLEWEVKPAGKADKPLSDLAVDDGKGGKKLPESGGETAEYEQDAPDPNNEAETQGAHQMVGKTLNFTFVDKGEWEMENGSYEVVAAATDPMDQTPVVILKSAGDASAPTVMVRMSDIDQADGGAPDAPLTPAAAPAEPAAPEAPGGEGLQPNTGSVNIESMTQGQVFEMNDGTQFVYHKPTPGGEFHIVKPVDGGKAKPLHAKYQPPKVGPAGSAGGEASGAVLPDKAEPEASDGDLFDKLAASVEQAKGGKVGGKGALADYETGEKPGQVKPDGIAKLKGDTYPQEPTPGYTGKGWYEPIRQAPQLQGDGCQEARRRVRRAQGSGRRGFRG